MDAATINAPATARAHIKPQRGIWVIYGEPHAWGTVYIGRKFFAGAMFAFEADDEVRAPSLEELRALLPEGLINVGRSEEDPATVIETWA
jgi:hypothetical protein